MRKKIRLIRLKQSIAFVIFLLAVAAMDSRLYITSGVLAIASAIYMYSTVVEEKRYVYELRRKRFDSRVGGTEGPGQEPDLGTYQAVEGRKQA